MHHSPQFVETARLRVAYYHLGTAGKPKLLLIHGNASSAVFYLPLMERLQGEFELIAPDLRCFGDTQVLPIDATLGMRTWSDDLAAFTQAIGWTQFALLGWSLGGGIVMQYAIDHSQQLTHVVLLSPLSPYGFGGTREPDGKKLSPLNLASGGGCVNQKLVEALASGDRAFLRTTLRTVYCKPPYLPAPEWEEIFIDGIASTKLGEGLYPGDSIAVDAWPFVCAGTRGVCNTMAPQYCDLSAFAHIPHRVPVLWFRGDSDLIASDTSLCDFGYLGQIGAVPGWPGPEACPPQPMASQTRHVLDAYQGNGGTYREVELAGAGHACHIEQEDAFVAELVPFLS